jgi:hypothetical protein
MCDAGSPAEDIGFTDACFDSTGARCDASLLADGFGFTGDSMEFSELGCLQGAGSTPSGAGSDASEHEGETP